MTFPVLFAVIVLVALVGPNVFNVILVIGVLGWPGLARLIRGQVLSLRETDYVTAARATGASDGRILRVHILPGVLPYVMVASTLGMASAILTEAALSFLGLGVQEPLASLGSLINDGAQEMQSAPWMLLVPAGFLVVLLMSFNLVTCPST